MSDNTDKAASCNRVPFLSEDGCDRGDVDIHQFDDLPYCEEIEPTPAEIPPEVLDTPVNIPIPPPCSCINIDYKLDFGYGTSAPKATFKAVGDCCDGNYESSLSLNLPCPVPTGIRKIKTSIGYGNGSGSKETLYYAKGKDCSFSITDITHDLQIECPIKVSGTTKISISLAYGSGSSSLSKDLASGDPGKCSISMESPEFNLNLPCPIVGSGTSTLTVGVGYGTGDSSKTVDYISGSGGADCSITPLSPEIDLSIPCPLPSGGRKMTLEIDYAQTPEKRKQFAVANFDSSSCKMTMYEPDVKLTLPCPVNGTGAKKMQLEVKFAKSPSPKKKFTIAETDNKNCNIKINEPEVTLTIPCPIPSGTHKLTMGVSYGSGGTQSVPYMTGSGGSSCSMTPLDPEVNLTIPCPLDSLSFSSMIRTGRSPAFTISKIGGGGGGCSAGFLFDLTVPDNSGIGINIGCQNGPLCSQRWNPETHSMEARRGRYYIENNVINMACDCSWFTVFTATPNTRDCCDGNNDGSNDGSNE